MRSGRRLVPQPVLQVMGVGGYAPHQADDVADHQLDHVARVRIRRVEHGHAVRARILQIDLVGADAEAADRRETGAGVDDLARHRGLGADA